jgi:hypothetical protein
MQKTKKQNNRRLYSRIEVELQSESSIQPLSSQKTKGKLKSGKSRS